MQKSSHRNGIATGILLPMGLVCLFAFCSLALALMGGRAYRQIQANVDDSYGAGVAASYLRTKLSQNNSAGAVSLRSEGETQVLVISSEAEGRAYETRIFFAEGQLLELFISAEAGFGDEGATRIAEVAGCNFNMDEDGLFTAEFISPSGAVARTAFATTRGGRL